MRTLVLLSLPVILFLQPANAQNTDALKSTTVRLVPELIARLPEELPQRVSGLAHDGEKLWMMIYMGHGSYATFNPVALKWQVADSEEHVRAIREVAGAFQSPGGVCFVDDKLWISDSYGESFGSIDLREGKVERLFKGKLREDRASQSYASMAYDGSNLWIAWHWFNYELPRSQTQLLLKIDPNSGKLIDKLAAPPGTAPDGTHGLTWDGKKLWHIKDNRLSAIDPANGNVTAQYTVAYVNRASGLAWDGEALWIVEFQGNLWRLRL